MQPFLSHAALFQNVFYQVHLIFVDGSSHPEVFCKISAIEILNFTRTIQYFELRSLEFVFKRLFFGGKTGLWSDLPGFFYMFSLDFRNILFLEELSWLFCHCVFFVILYWLGVDLL